MDNRTGFRRRGPAYLADQARQTLGVHLEPRPLAEIPPPLIHTAFGAAVCGLAVVLRPELLGQTKSALAGIALGLLTALVLPIYDALIYPAERRPALDGVALPVAAVAAFCTVLAGVPQLAIRVAAGVIAALVIGGIPQLIGRQVAGGGRAYRFLRDIAGVVVLAPVLLAGVSRVLPFAPRLALVGATVLLVSYDGLRNEPLSAQRAAAGALLSALAITLAVYLAGPSGSTAGIRAALLLVLWYGVRGMAAELVAARVRHGVLVLAEYAAFVVLAAGALRWVILSQ